MHFFAEKDRIMWWILLLMFDLCHFNWEKQKRGVSKPGVFPLFWGKVQIVSRTLSGLFLVGAVHRPRKRKMTNRENPRRVPGQIGKIPEKSGKSQKDKKDKKSPLPLGRRNVWLFFPRLSLWSRLWILLWISWWIFQHFPRRLESTLEYSSWIRAGIRTAILTFMRENSCRIRSARWSP